jgi:hypothetical protein
VQESLQKVIWMGLLSMETKQHTSLLEWKVKMLQILPIIVKMQVLYLKQDQQYVYHYQVKKKRSKVGCNNRAKNTKMY